MRSRLWIPTLALVAATGVLSTSASAQTVPSPDVAQQAVDGAQAQVDALQAQVEAATAELIAGTTRLEESQARLAATQRQAEQARAASEQARIQAATERARLANVVRKSYLQPAPSDLQLVLVAPPGTLSETTLASAELGYVRSNQNDLLRSADAARLKADQLQTEADQLEAEASAQQAEVAAQVTALTARAEQIKTQLTEANAQLEAAQAARTEAEKAEAARQAAAAAAAATAATASSSSTFRTFSATCDGAPGVSSYANGFLPASALCPIGVGSHALRADAAAAFQAMNAAYGNQLCVTDSYRSYAGQVDVFARKPGLAAVPGTSNHGWGVAVDFCGGIETFGTPAHEWMVANARQFGWTHPSWAQQGGSRPEAWHWEFVGV